MTIRHRGYTGTANLTKTKHLLILPDAFTPRQNNSDLTLKVNGQDHLLQVSDTAPHSFASKVVAVQQPCTDQPAQAPVKLLVLLQYTQGGGLVSQTTHYLSNVRVDAGFLLFSHLWQGYPKSKIRCRPQTSLVQLLQGREVMVQERYRGTITFQTNKRSYRQGISQETLFSFPISRSLLWKGRKTDPFC